MVYGVVGEQDWESRRDRNLPFSVQTSPQEITRKGDTASIDVIITPSTSVSEDRVNMTASATFTPTGDLGNSTSSFSKDSFCLSRTRLRS